MLWILCLINSLFHYIFLSGFSLTSSTETSSSAFFIMLNISASVYFGETLTYYILEMVYLGGSIPTQTVCMPSAIGGRAGFDADESQMFPQCVQQQ